MEAEKTLKERTEEWLRDTNAALRVLEQALTKQSETLRVLKEAQQTLRTAINSAYGLAKVVGNNKEERDAKLAIITAEERSALTRAELENDGATLRVESARIRVHELREARYALQMLVMLETGRVLRDEGAPELTGIA